MESMKGEGEASSSGSAALAVVDHKSTRGKKATLKWRLGSKTLKAKSLRPGKSKIKARIRKYKEYRKEYRKVFQYWKMFPDLSQTEVYARVSLDRFNKKNEALGRQKYELVEALELNSNAVGDKKRLFVHVNFKAKSKNAPDTEAVLFFGEVPQLGGIKIKCCVLNSGHTQGKCACSLIHPPRGFRPATWVTADTSNYAPNAEMWELLQKAIKDKHPSVAHFGLLLDEMEGQPLSNDA